jgi:hypothetical protein
MSILRFTTASDVFAAFPTARQDISAGPSDEEVLDFLDALVAKRQWRDAVSYCAYLLPRREAVAWACRCVRYTDGEPESKDEVALEAAEAWVADPLEESRVAALAVGLKGDRERAATWAALAAGWSGGNFFLSENRFGHPPRHATAKAVLAAVMFAAMALGRSREPENFATFVEFCREMIGQT